MQKHTLEKVVSKTTNQSGILDISLELVKAGLVFFPCTPDKKPLVKEWQKLNKVNASQARAWHKQWSDMMLGLPAGNNGLLVIDLDKAKKPDEPDGLDEFKDLCAKHTYDFTKETLCAQTTSGGLHVFYHMPDGYELRNTAKRLGNAIDTRGYGGYVILAPSKNEGGQYRWLYTNPIAELPDWLLSLLEKPQATIKTFQESNSPAGLYASNREKMAYQAAFESECANVENAVEGTRNEVLNVASYNLGKYIGAGKLDENEVYNSLYRAAQKCGLDDREISKTIRSGLNSGKQYPKEIEPHNGSWEQKNIKNESRQRQPDPQATLENNPTIINAGKELDAFMDAANEFAKTSAIPTGYSNLDGLLEGGLYPGLYVIGAIPSLGKTTFVLQMADAIAKAGHDVLIFSLEMSRHELMAKTLSRISLQEKIRKRLPESYAKPARDYLTGKWCADHIGQEEGLAMIHAFDVYKQWADKIYIVEGCYSLNVLSVVELTKSHIEGTGHKPVVIIDYLQVLAPLSDHYNDKQNIDRSIVELKRLSRDLNLPVLTVSSFNRDNYTVKATMQAFKETGSIEYTSDILIGLQFKGMTEKKDSFDVDAAKKADPRQIELLLIKNRHGQCGNAQLNYYPKYNLFTI